MRMPATVSQLLISSSTSSPMEARAEVHAVPGRGLAGDRYYAGEGTFSPNPQQSEFELTLIESEKIEAFATESGLPFTALLARRNIVTAGVDLNALAGKEFLIGDVRLRGTGLCEPCSHLAKGTFPEIMEGLLHKGGLRAQILTEGKIRVGDPLRVCEDG